MFLLQVVQPAGPSIQRSPGGGRARSPLRYVTTHVSYSNFCPFSVVILWHCWLSDCEKRKPCKIIKPRSNISGNIKIKDMAVVFHAAECKHGHLLSAAQPVESLSWPIRWKQNDCAGPSSVLIGWILFECLPRVWQLLTLTNNDVEDICVGKILWKCWECCCKVTGVTVYTLCKLKPSSASCFCFFWN